MSIKLIQRDYYIKLINIIKMYLGSTNCCKASQLPNDIIEIYNMSPKNLYRMYIERDFDNFFLPKESTKVPSCAFYGCTNLALTSLPEGLTDIGQYAFYGCTNLALTSLPEGLTEINFQSFDGCTNLALTSLPEGVTRIDNYGFAYCTNLALTSLPEGLVHIGAGAFEECKNLSITYIPKNVENIDWRAFANCTSLTEVTFEGTSTSIYSGGVFDGCTNLTTINVPWAEGEVEGAPWGATNATINYNYVGVDE